MRSFFLHSVSANLMIAKKQANARKTPEIVRFRGFEAMISFSASQYVSRRRKRYRFQIRKALPNTCRFQFAAQPAPTLSVTAIILAVYFFNLRLIPYIPTMPFQKTILCYNSIGSRRRLTILVLAEVQLWK